MYEVLIALTILMSIGVGWSIGANDAANSLGTAVGAKVISLRTGILLIMVFGFLGAMLQGNHVAKTIGKGIADLSVLDPQTSALVALVACFSACTWVVLATYWKMPISTSHSIVGAVAGAALALGMPIQWRVLGEIFACWILTPLGSAVLGYLLFTVLQLVFPRIVPERAAKPVLTTLIIASGCYVAYSWGANDVANATGILVGTGILSVNRAVALGGLSIILGVITWGYKVIETIGNNIAHLLPLMAFSAQLASGLNVHLYTLLGIPVSTSHSIVGAVFGVGLVKGVKVLNIGILREIVACWLATPFVSGVVAFLLLKTVVFFIR